MEKSWNLTKQIVILIVPTTHSIIFRFCKKSKNNSLRTVKGKAVIIHKDDSCFGEYKIN